MPAEHSGPENVDEAGFVRSAYEFGSAFTAVLMGPEHIYQAVNPAYAELVGERDLIGRSVRDAHPEMQAQGFMELLDHVYASGQPYFGTEVKVVLKERSDQRSAERFVTFVYQPLVDESGETTGIVAQGIDISALIHERKLEEMGAQAAVLSTVSEAIVIVDLNGQITFANPAAHRMLGLTKSEAPGRAYNDPAWSITAVDGGPFPEDELPFVRVMATGRPVQGIEHAIDYADGRRVILSINAAPLRDLSGKRIGMVASMRDVTEARRAAVELSELHSQLETVINTCPLPIVVINNEKNVQVWNVAAEKVFGWTQQEVLNKPYPLRGLDPANGPEEIFRKAFEGDLAEGEAVTRVSKDGRELYLNVWNAILNDARGNSQGYLGIFTDLSEQRRLESELLHSQKLESVGRLAGGIAHDFNNMLTALLGHAALVQEALPDEHPLRADVFEIQRGAQRAAALTHQLLAFSRKQIMQPSILNVASVVADVQRMVERMMGENIRLSTRFDDNLWPIKADAGQIQQVILNLAVNAYDAMPDGGTFTITGSNITLAAEDKIRRPSLPIGEYVEIMVEDNGSGMHVEVLRVIFDPFFTTKELGKGTGLGLATVYGILKQSGGYIFVESEPGQGTTFRMLLPRSFQLESAADTRTTGPGIMEGTETLLLAEDDKSVRELSIRVLSRRGYRVLAAANGPEAIVLAGQNDDIAMLITDMAMPEMDGRQLAERFEALRPGVPVLFMSGYTEEAVLHDSTPDSMRAFLPKPFTPAELCICVREVLDRNKRPPTVNEGLATDIAVGGYSALTDN